MNQSPNPFQTKRILKTILLIGFVLGIFATTVRGEEAEKKIFSSKNIDITLKDSNGYNHFLVFTKTMTPDKSYVAYNVEFWVNNYVYSGTDAYSQIVFKTPKKNYYGSFYKSDVSSNALVLYFYLEESVIHELQNNAGSADKVSVTLKNKTILEHTIATKEHFKKALREITTVE
ncbi:hypothetical protein EHQ76_18075 [Leptospira barantonii]|uniref:Uncharacterized protein n=1 Tax=Leptospira barantonii TaxID=2023184 RepID=A0A5F2AYE5_9LEPT|nr:hypothetical protein [Leptospira barantonii]TGL93293.1 hypothetical protein EHQ76_18075 [Leptospira barantonii]